MQLKKYHRRVQRALKCALLVLIGAGNIVAAQSISDSTKQKQAAEKQRVELQKQLEGLQQQINQTQSAKETAQDVLADSEKAISNANRTLRELYSDQQQVNAQISVLEAQGAHLTRVIAQQKDQLSRWLKQQYVAGNEDRMKLLLSGDNPNRINRELRYMGYISQAQAQLVESLRANLDEVQKNQSETETAQENLNNIIAKQQEQKQVLEKETAKHRSLVASLSTKLTSQRKEAGGIQKNEQRLSGLVDQLSKVIEEQKRKQAAERARRIAEEKARRAREAKEAAAAAALAKKDSARGGTKVAPKVKEEAPLARNEETPSADEGNFGQSFAGLRGKLRLPIRGDIMQKFGSQRGDGVTSKGIFIRASEGSEVKAVAAGRVVYADWLRGFGNLMIIDHGNQYMTIYGNNQSLLKSAGDIVKTGDVIATAGNSGGNNESGLYFEMRYQGRAFDPAGWVHN